MTLQQLKAMKLALEALELLTDTEQTFGALDYGDNAITAIKEALAEHAMREVQRLGQEIEQEPVAYLCENAVGHRYFRWKKPSSTYKPIALYTTPPQRTEQEPVAWLLTDKNINSLQVDSIQRLIDRLKHAHHTDLCVRINGQDEWFQADWLKHMVRATPPQRTEQEREACAKLCDEARAGRLAEQIRARGADKELADQVLGAMLARGKDT